MESQFENRFFSTHAMVAEYYRKVAMGFWLPMVILVVALTARLLLGLILVAVLDGATMDMLGSFLMMAALCAAVVFMPDWAVWNVLRRIRSQNGGVEPETVITVGDRVEVARGISHATIDFEKIVRVRRLKHSYLLMITKRDGIMVRPDSFTKGTFAEFKNFLREKRPDLNIPE